MQEGAAIERPCTKTLCARRPQVGRHLIGGYLQGGCKWGGRALGEVAP